MNGAGGAPPLVRVLRRLAATLGLYEQVVKSVAPEGEGLKLCLCREEQTRHNINFLTRIQGVLALVASEDAPDTAEVWGMLRDAESRLLDLERSMLGLIGARRLKVLQDKREEFRQSKRWWHRLVPGQAARFDRVERAVQEAEERLETWKCRVTNIRSDYLEDWGRFSDADRHAKQEITEADPANWWRVLSARDKASFVFRILGPLVSAILVAVWGRLQGCF